MRQPSGVYTQVFNRCHRTGHLLQGRYKAILVEKESHLLELARYIVLNSVRAKLIRHPRAWRWSSYRATAGEEAPRFLTTDWILSQFHRDQERARREYRKFVSRGKGVDVWADLRGGVILGSERFVERREPLLRERASELEIPRRERLAARPILEELFAKVKSKADWNERVYQAVRGYGYLSNRWPRPRSEN